jgi:hypothetical protein
MTSVDAVRTSGQPYEPGDGDAEQRKNDFYVAVFNAAERILLDVAQEIDGLDKEIAVLRMELRAIMTPKKNNRRSARDIKLMLRAMDMLNRLVSTRYRISKKSQRDLAENMANVLQGVRSELGIGEDSGPGA